jgi:hypothetical protein
MHGIHPLSQISVCNTIFLNIPQKSSQFKCQYLKNNKFGIARSDSRVNGDS